MKELNLVYPDRGDIPFKITTFPDGQKLVKIEGNFPYNEQVLIKTRLSWDDVQTLICVVKALREPEVYTPKIHLFISYLIGSRSDRKFDQGSINYLKQVICPIINELNFSSVTVLDPHSYSTEMGLNNFIKQDNSQLVQWALKEIDSEFYIPEEGQFVFISPDEGASKKLPGLVKSLNLNIPIVTCYKDRDIKTGEITGVRIGNVVDFEGKDVYIVDDICDGGRTFIELAQKIKPLNIGNLYLIITHGIFSKGFDELGKYFDNIFTTNSFETNLRQIPNFVKILNIF
jgi:ribose-phosphate pyrophosphokinase